MHYLDINIKLVTSLNSLAGLRFIMFIIFNCFTHALADLALYHHASAAYSLIHFYNNQE